MTIMKVNNVDINYEQTGQGEAVVFLHGFTGSNRDWTNQINAISDKYRTIAVDHRGHGGSGAPDNEEDYSIEIFCQDVHALLKGLDIDKCCLVGHSMGGFMSLQFILDHPEMVRALVLVDTSSGDWEKVPGAEEHRARLDEIARSQGMEAAFEYDAENNALRVERFRKHPEQREIARRKHLQTSVNGYIYVARTFNRWGPVTPRLNEIKVPTLIFLGGEDAGFVKASQVMRDGIAGAELLMVPGVGHNPHEEAPGIFNERFVNFLSEIR